MLIHAFGIAKDIVGDATCKIELLDETTVANLKEMLYDQFPELAALKHFAIAVNAEYATDDTVISVNDEVVIIPPVSGG